MTSDTPGSFDAVLEAIWQKHRHTMFERLATIERAVEALERGVLTESDRADAHRTAHKLAGSLGSFGVHAGSTAARTLETAFQDDGVTEGREDVQHSELRTAVSALRTAIEARP